MIWAFGESIGMNVLVALIHPTPLCTFFLNKVFQKLVSKLCSPKEKFDNLRGKILKMESYKLGKTIEN